MIKKACKTVFLNQAINNEEALNLFTILRDIIEWEDGIPSRKHGFTRKAKPISIGDYPFIDDIITLVLNRITTQNYLINHIYLNYYEDGDMFTPNHSHPGTHQLVISLGGTRTLNVATKSYNMKNGDAIIFGSAIHGVPKEDTYEPRISIATFMYPINNNI